MANRSPRCSSVRFAYKDIFRIQGQHPQICPCMEREALSQPTPYVLYWFCMKDLGGAAMAAAPYKDMSLYAVLVWRFCPSIAAVRRLGQLIKTQKATVGLARGASAGGTKDGPRGSFTDPRDDRPTLAEAGIDKHLADRARKRGSVTDPRFRRPPPRRSRQEAISIRNGSATDPILPRSQKRL